MILSYFEFITDFINQMTKDQNGICPICRKPLHAKDYFDQKHLKINQQSVIEHDHKTGLICSISHNGCNKHSGFFEKFKINLIGVHSYLNKHGRTEKPKRPPTQQQIELEYKLLAEKGVTFGDTND